METLRDIFPRMEPPPKRDFLKENVIKIKNMQRMQKSKGTEYSSKFSKPVKAHKLCLYDDRISPRNRLSNSQASYPIKARAAHIENLRKSFSKMSLSRDYGTQTVDPNEDEYFLKDTIIRYPSASTIRSLNNIEQVCSRSHLKEQEKYSLHQQRSKFQTNIGKDNQAYSKMKHGEISDKDLEFRKSKSCSSSLLKLNKNSFNESQQNQNRHNRMGNAHNRIIIDDTIVIDSDDNENGIIGLESKSIPTKEEPFKSRHNDSTDINKQEKVAEEDPDCPDKHVLLAEDERMNSLKTAKKSFKELVDELNRLPMTCETLRVRNRKIEIEKELRKLEKNIRVFSQPKVYVKLSE